MLITDEYRRLNAELHKTAGGYGSKGGKWAPRVWTFAQSIGAASILDYGCGKGSLKGELQAFGGANVYEIREYDPAIAGKDAPPAPADLVVCTDVLEHVEPESIDEVFADLVRLANKAVLVAVACRAGKRKLADGRPDHLTVQPPLWWARRASKAGTWSPIESLRALEWAAVLRK
jgi:hypothetical protein